jgi:hypothetical protein
MRNLALAGAIAPLLLLCGCGQQSVAGKYRCDGIPDMASLELREDGTAVQSGEMLGHQIAGTGTYTADSAHVAVVTDVKTSGDGGAILDEHKDDMTFEKQSNGDLKWILATCKKL